MTFEIIGETEAIETIATGTSVKVRSLLRKLYGRGRWRKRKGIATVRLANGNIRRVELHPTFRSFAWLSEALSDLS